jgi:hypothetical protein
MNWIWADTRLAVAKTLLLRNTGNQNGRTIFVILYLTVELRKSS